MVRAKGDADINPEQREQIIGYLIAFLKAHGKLNLGSISSAVDHFRRDHNTIKSVWNACDITERPKHPGPARKYVPDELNITIKEIPVIERRTVRSAAAALEMPPSTLQEYIGKGGRYAP
jgi:hypothetical protein